MEVLKTNLANLIKVKTLVTLSVNGAFIYLACTGKITPEMFMTVYTVIVSFYFGMQVERASNAKQTTPVE